MENDPNPYLAGGRRRIQRRNARHTLNWIGAVPGTHPSKVPDPSVQFNLPPPPIKSEIAGWRKGTIQITFISTVELQDNSNEHT